MKDTILNPDAIKYSYLLARLEKAEFVVAE